MPGTIGEQVQVEVESPSGVAMTLDQVAYSIRGRRTRQAREILKDVTLSLHRGEAVAVMGPSGVGKSTLLAICGGLLQATSGAVSVSGIDLGRVSTRERARVRSLELGMVFQHAELLNELSPLDNVALPALLSPSNRIHAYERARHLLDLMGLNVEGTPTDRLSGGERQRVALARALVNAPQVVLADEPTGALDAATRDEVAEHLFGLRHSLQSALLVVTHDESIASRADRAFELRGGTLRVMT